MALLQNVKQLQQRQLKLTAHFLDDFYDEWLYNKIPSKKKADFEFTLDDVSNYDTFSDWAQKVVWYGHRTGAYLYGDIRMEKDIAGHY